MLSVCFMYVPLLNMSRSSILSTNITLYLVKQLCCFPPFTYGALCGLPLA